MEFTVEGSVIEGRLLQWLKQFVGIAVMALPSAKTALASALHAPNVLLPIAVTPAGMIMPVSAVQVLNAPSSIVARADPASKVRVVSEVQLWKEIRPMKVTVRGIVPRRPLLDLPTGQGDSEVYSPCLLLIALNFLGQDMTLSPSAVTVSSAYLSTPCVHLHFICLSLQWTMLPKL